MTDTLAAEAPAEPVPPAPPEAAAATAPEVEIRGQQDGQATGARPPDR